MTTREFLAAAGITLRQAQWWERLGIVRSTRVPGAGQGGFRREYHQTDVDRARVVIQFVRKGMAARNVLGILQRTGWDRPFYAVVEFRHEQHRYLAHARSLADLKPVILISRAPIKVIEVK